MRHEKWLSSSIHGVLAACIAMGGAGCLVTAFSLTNADLSVVLWLTVLTAVLMILAENIKFGLPVLGGCALLALSILFFEGSIAQHIEALVQEISEFYDRGYGWGIVVWTDPDLMGTDITGAVALLSCFVCASVCLVLNRRLPAVLAVLAGILPLAACCVVTDTVPEEGYLALFLMALCLMILTNGVRRRSRREALRLTALLLVPVLLAGNLLFFLFPRDGYEIAAGSLQQTVLSWFNTLPFVTHTPNGDLTIQFGPAVSAQRINLAGVGPKADLKYAILDAVTETSGKLYLRGQAFEKYDGKNWYTVHYEDLKDNYWPTQGLQEAGKVTLSLRSEHQQLYFPYCPSDPQWFDKLQDGKLDNPDGLREYSWTWMKPAEDAKYDLPSGYDGTALREQCLQLPEESEDALRDLLKQLLPAGSYVYTVREKVQIIGDYVQNVAKYSLNTPRMSDEYEDFALWFLNEANTGYCIHFATAATVLLRAAGIPARYVTGYAMDVQADTKNTFTADKSHAWVEYLDPSTGWTILEATPQMEEQEPEPSTEPTTEPTEPPLPTKPTHTEGTEPSTDPSTEPTAEPTTEPTGESSRPTTLPDGETTAPTSSAAPGLLPGAPGSSGTAGPGSPWLILILLVSLGLGVLAGGLWLSWSLRVRHRQKRLHTGHPNQRCLYAWRHSLWLGKKTGRTPPVALERLAEKAKFSQHTLTEEELEEFNRWFAEATALLKEKNPLTRLWLSLIYGIKL